MVPFYLRTGNRPVRLRYGAGVAHAIASTVFVPIAFGATMQACAIGMTGRIIKAIAHRIGAASDFMCRQARKKCPINLTERNAVSTHFSIEELIFSQTAVRKSIDNTPPPAVLDNLQRLMETLELVRALTGPLAVSSGYRSPALNAAVGGAKNSAHVLGLAADITCKGMTPKALATLIRDSKIPFQQLIFEGSWVHIGLSDGVMAREVLTATFSAGKATYTRGIA